MLAICTVDSGELTEAGTRDGARQRRLAAQLQRKLDQHRMSNRPFLICRMDPAEPHGDTSLLDAFAAEVGSLAATGVPAIHLQTFRCRLSCKPKQAYRDILQPLCTMND